LYTPAGFDRIEYRAVDVDQPLQPGQPEAETCLNCGESLHGRYCSSCGQAVVEPNQPLRQVLSAWFGALIAFDSRIIRTLKPLVIKPGFLTIEYFAGRRASYVAPFKLYIFFSCVMFLAIAMTDYQVVTVQRGDSGKVVAPIHIGLDDKETEQRGSESAPASPGEPSLMLEALEEAARDEKALSADIVAQLPKALFLLVPAFALMLRVFYRKGPHRYVRHLIFALHLHSLAFLLLTTGMLLTAATGIELFSPLLTLYFVVYVFKSFRRIYQEGRVKTLLRLLLLWFVYSLTFAVTAALTLLVVVGLRLLG
jgi:hypothetical protein